MLKKVLFFLGSHLTVGLKELLLLRCCRSGARRPRRALALFATAPLFAGGGGDPPEAAGLPVDVGGRAGGEAEPLLGVPSSHPRLH